MGRHLWTVILLCALGQCAFAYEAGGGAPPPPRIRVKPRCSAVVPYPAPAVAPDSSGGIMGPYGPGLAAAAPIGTPYLRSPAFAGPPIIYMPQTVTRILVPASTPYPSSIMPAGQYAYSSAPFMRTDIYVDLPYGTYYWPQGYAGTTPVEPQVPGYVIAPAEAVMSNQAQYTTRNYAQEAREKAAPITAQDAETIVPLPATAATPAPPPVSPMPTPKFSTDSRLPPPAPPPVSPTPTPEQPPVSPPVSPMPMPEQPPASPPVSPMPTPEQPPVPPPPGGLPPPPDASAPPMLPPLPGVPVPGAAPDPALPPLPDASAPPPAPTPANPPPSQ